MESRQGFSLPWLPLDCFWLSRLQPQQLSQVQCTHVKVISFDIFKAIKSILILDTNYIHIATKTVSSLNMFVKCNVGLNVRSLYIATVYNRFDPVEFLKNRKLQDNHNYIIIQFSCRNDFRQNNTCDGIQPTGKFSYFEFNIGTSLYKYFSSLSQIRYHACLQRRYTNLRL